MHAKCISFQISRPNCNRRSLLLHFMSNLTHSSCTVGARPVIIITLLFKNGCFVHTFKGVLTATNPNLPLHGVYSNTHACVNVAPIQRYCHTHIALLSHTYMGNATLAQGIFLPMHRHCHTHTLAMPHPQNGTVCILLTILKC